MQDLEKQIRLLEKKLDRSQQKRVTLERLRDKDQIMYKKILSDLSEARALLERSNRELRNTQAQLVQQEKMASLGRLTAGIAHEIKNPLNFVNNFARLSKELFSELLEAIHEGDAASIEVLLSDLKLNVEKIEEHGERADSIVRAMMQHTLGSSGEREVVDFNALVTQYVDLAFQSKRVQMPDFNVGIARDLAVEVGMIKIQPQEIGRVLSILLTNAFDALEERTISGKSDYEPKVHVSTRRTDEGEIEVQVSDNGVGIPDQVRDKVFEPFFSTKPAGKGTGLGLSLAYDIVTQGHGGRLEVESGKSEGATFLMVLPAFDE